jgi:hypothetical protein
MSRLLLNLDELNIRHEQFEEMRLKIYDEILQNCHNKIKKFNNDFKKYECLFSPPVFIIGKPPYNFPDLISYMIKSLRGNGLRAEWLPQKRSIYVSWRKSDIDMNRYHTHFSEITYNSDMTQQMSIVKVNPVEITETKGSSTSRKKKKDEKPVQHLAMLEYGPGAQDLIPINVKGM